MEMHICMRVQITRSQNTRAQGNGNYALVYINQSQRVISMSAQKKLNWFELFYALLCA